jgi:serine/threonine protein kinase
MDPVRAERISKELVGSSVGGWRVNKYLGNGKSAVVFEGEKDAQHVALKVFDPELVDRFGKETQLERINRELLLVGEKHPNLVEIFDGGECVDSGYLYVAMELIKSPNLADSITFVPREKIFSVLQQVASAAKFLEGKQLAHRDIKPENIVVNSDFSRAVLLDLGVLRPFGDAGLTDEDAKVFIGTLRYSSPEFLLREENDTEDGWRAVTFYQLGALLHDLIMHRPLFEEFSEPYALLVEAVRSEKPNIHADDASPDLILLARNCLVKNPLARLNLVSWEDFEVKAEDRSTSDTIRERVKRRSLLARTSPERESSEPWGLSEKQIAKLVTERLDSIIRNECAGNDAFPKMQIRQSRREPVFVCVKFAVSRAHDLFSELSIRFDSELIDEATMAFKVVVSSCLLRNDSDHDSAPEAAIIFRGPLDSRALATAVQDALWSAIDTAQGLGEKMLSLEDVHWLNISSDGEDDK